MPLISLQNLPLHHLRRHRRQTSEIPKLARLVAVDGAGTAWEGHVDDVVGALPPTEETGVRVGGSPDADDRTCHEGCEVHVAGVHGYHLVEMRHEDELLLYALEQEGG